MAGDLKYLERAGAAVANSDESAEEIRKRMAELRRELTSDVDDVSRSVREVGRSAKEMASPLYLIRNYPWVSAAVAGAVGYLLIPKRKQQQVVKPDPELLAELVRKEQIKLDTSKASGETDGMLKSLAVMGITWAAKQGMSYMVQRFTTAAMNMSHEETADRGESPEATPIDEPWNTAR
ncbi:MAG TPA: hypothetical protein VH107_03220 [Lacipirellulaceae bacterium]|nr:hypothetical protein [Lacipirellulaceae bacterium]